MVDDEIWRKSRAALAAAVIVADGDFHRIDFAAAREVWLANLTPAERNRAAEIEAEFDACSDRRTADAVRFLEQLGCSNVPPAEGLH